MRCTGFCISETIQLPQIMLYFQKQNKQCRISKDAVIVSLGDKKTQREIICFSYGAIVFWGLTKEEEELYLKEINLRTPSAKLYPAREEDHFHFEYGKKFGILEDVIILPSKEFDIKLAVSHGIAQSIKLSVFEQKIQRKVQDAKLLPETLQKKGKISLSRKKTLKQMGDIFVEKNNVNLHTDILDTPDYFWAHPEREEFYQKIISYLDLKQRVDVLNRRMNVLNDLYEMLNTQLNHSHSSKLEWTIIILIVIEVVLAILRDIFHLI